MTTADTLELAKLHRFWVLSGGWALVAGISIAVVLIILELSEGGAEGSIFFSFIIPFFLAALVWLFFWMKSLVDMMRILEDSDAFIFFFVVAIFLLSAFVPFGEWVLILYMQFRVLRTLKDQGIDTGFFVARKQSLERWNLPSETSPESNAPDDD